VSGDSKPKPYHQVPVTIYRAFFSTPFMRLFPVKERLIRTTIRHEYFCDLLALRCLSVRTQPGNPETIPDSVLLRIHK